MVLSLLLRNLPLQHMSITDCSTPRSPTSATTPSIIDLPLGHICISLPDHVNLFARHLNNYLLPARSSANQPIQSRCNDKVTLTISNDIFTAAQQCLASCCVADKLRLTKETAQQWREGGYTLTPATPPQPIGETGRPAKPLLVKPADVPRRGLGSEAGRAALIHAITHIEFNAINLAWDAVYRFRGLPQQYYSDWIRVADEEAYHFALLSERLQDLGHHYGDFPAHNGLWAMAQKTADDPMVRMALVPRVLEARGLDVTPGMMQRLKKAGDEESVAILEIILRDEIGHVEIGSRWFKYLCDERGLNPASTFRELVSAYFIGELRGPFDYTMRQQAGFSTEELEALEKLAAQPAID